MLRRIIRSLVVISSLMGVSAYAMQGWYLTRPYETILRPEFLEDYSFAAWVLPEVGFSEQLGLNEHGDKVDVLRIWQPEQNALKMLNGFSPSSAIGERAILIDANDDGIRGHYLVSGNLREQFGMGMAARWALPNYWTVALYLPFYAFELKDVLWQNLTQNVTADDARTREYLTNDFFSNVAQLGKGLDLQGWKRAGIGDLTLIFEWLRDFEQNKDFLKNVQLQGRLGFLLPTGLREDDDKLYALSYGLDGAWGLLFGGQLQLRFADYLRFALDVELTQPFSTRRERRIKTAFEQTELLLLEKVDAVKYYGLIQRFNLSLELFKFVGGLSAKVAYQYVKHDEDTLALCTNAYPENIANSALSLQEWTLHNMFFVMSYDGSDECERRYHPYVSAFVKVPFNGKFTVMNQTVGVVLSLDF